MLFLARGIEDHNYMVVEQVDGVLVDAAWRVEREAGGFMLSHADDSALTAQVQLIGPFPSAEDAVVALHAFLARG